MKILAVSDEVVERLYTLCTSGHFSEIDLILGCGDLPYPYLENLLTFLNIPLFYVPGNHDPTFNPENPLAHVEGASHLDLKVARYKKVLIGGFGGSIRYRPNVANQYSQTDAYLRAFQHKIGEIGLGGSDFSDFVLKHTSNLMGNGIMAPVNR